MSKDERTFQVIRSLEEDVQSFIATRYDAARDTPRFKELADKFFATSSTIYDKVENSEAGRNGFFTRIARSNAAMQELISYIITVDPSPIDDNV